VQITNTKWVTKTPQHLLLHDYNHRSHLRHIKHMGCDTKYCYHRPFLQKQKTWCSFLLRPIWGHAIRPFCEESVAIVAIVADESILAWDGGRFFSNVIIWRQFGRKSCKTLMKWSEWPSHLLKPWNYIVTWSSSMKTLSAGFKSWLEQSSVFFVASGEAEIKPMNKASIILHRAHQVSTKSKMESVGWTIHVDQESQESIRNLRYWKKNLEFMRKYTFQNPTASYTS
jgi:hypothetical protein